MNSRELKKLLRDALEVEKELYDFCVECLTRIYGEKAPRAIQMFEENFDHFDDSCCIYSLEYIDKYLESEKLHHQEWLAKQSK